MENASPNLDAAKRSLEGAELAMRRLQSAVTADIPAFPADQLRSATKTAMSALADLGRALSAGDVEISRVACPSCGRMVMPAATLCGFCWRGMVPKSEP